MLRRGFDYIDLTGKIEVFFKKLLLNYERLLLTEVVAHGGPTTLYILNNLIVLLISPFSGMLFCYRSTNNQIGDILKGLAPFLKARNLIKCIIRFSMEDLGVLDTTISR